MARRPNHLVLNEIMKWHEMDGTFTVVGTSTDDLEMCSFLAERTTRLAWFSLGNVHLRAHSRICHAHEARVVRVCELEQLVDDNAQENELRLSC